MSPGQISEERRRGRLAGMAAFVSAILLVAGEIWSQAINGDAPAGNGPAALRFLHRHSGGLIGASVLRVVGLVLFVSVAVHLSRAIKARRPEEPGFVQVMAVYGPLAWAAGPLAVSFALVICSSPLLARRVVS